MAKGRAHDEEAWRHAKKICRLTMRQVEMAATKEQLSRESAKVKLVSEKHSLMARIQNFLWGRTHR